MNLLQYIIHFLHHLWGILWNGKMVKEIRIGSLKFRLPGKNPPEKFEMFDGGSQKTLLNPKGTIFLVFCQPFQWLSQQ